jgi:hypothetical protein
MNTSDSEALGAAIDGADLAESSTALTSGVDRLDKFLVQPA